MKRKIKDYLIVTVCCLSICYFAGFVLACFTKNNFKLKLELKYLFDAFTFRAMGMFLLVAIFFVALYINNNYWRMQGKKIIEGDERDLHLSANLEQSRFQSEDEMKKNFEEIDFDSLKNSQITGSVIKAEEKNNKLKVTFSKPAHTLVIGTTGSGKTSTFVNPIIRILGETKTKPSMFISDPKGELYSYHAKELRDKGYEVKVLDLRNPYNSVRWNPLERAYICYQKMLHLEDEVITDEENGCYIFEGEVFYDFVKLKTVIQVKKQQLYDIVYEDLHDIATAICPISNKNEPMWESGAQNLVLAIALAMLEDSEVPELELTKEKFNLYSISKVATKTDNDCEYLISYFENRNPLSKAVSLSKQVLDASDKTRGSYLSSTFDKLSMFSDLSLCALTSENEIEFAEMGEKPIALFLQIPDEKETRHTLASLVILQAYKELVHKANSYENLTLPRPVYFILDEFGNLPKIHKLEQMITVGRSRNIWMNLIIQSYSQLSKVYDEKSADIIKSNCNIQVFIGTTDYKTIDEFSKRCGNFSMMQRSIGFNSVKSQDLNSNTSIKERPLIYPSELQMLNSSGNMGNAIVTVFGYHPIKSKFTPCYKSKFYQSSFEKQELYIARFFDEEKAFYDMTKKIELDNSKKPKDEEKPVLKPNRKVPTEMIVENILELIRRNNNLFSDYHGRRIRAEVKNFQFRELLIRLGNLHEEAEREGDLEKANEINHVVERIKVILTKQLKKEEDVSEHKA